MQCKGLYLKALQNSERVFCFVFFFLRNGISGEVSTAVCSLKSAASLWDVCGGSWGTVLRPQNQGLWEQEDRSGPGSGKGGGPKRSLELCTGTQLQAGKLCEGCNDSEPTHSWGSFLGHRVLSLLEPEPDLCHLIPAGAGSEGTLHQQLSLVMEGTQATGHKQGPRMAAEAERGGGLQKLSGRRAWPYCGGAC